MIMNELKAVEVTNLQYLDVSGMVGQNIFDAARECIWLANVLKRAVRLYWNGEYIFVFTNSTVEDIICKAVEQKKVSNPENEQ